MLKHNLIANYLGQGWLVLMNIAFVPLYIKYLGIESYGLIGVFTILQSWLGLFEIGITPTLSREMARFSVSGRSLQSVLDLLRSMEVVVVGVAFLIILGVHFVSPWLSINWIKSENITFNQVSQALSLMGIVVAMRLLESMYRSSIVGLQRQVLLNLLSSIMITVRSIGAIFVLAWISPTIQAFFLWQVVTSIITVSAYAVVVYNTLPRSTIRAKISIKELSGVWKFASGMLGITVLSLLLMQLDKILLSKQLSLTEFGYYTIASTVAAALFSLISPITQAVYPRLCELHASGDVVALGKIYHISAQLISVTAGSVAIVIILFSEIFLRLWAGDQNISESTCRLLSLLMLGNLLNGLMWIPYQTQLAHGWTSLTMFGNALAILIAFPVLLFIVPLYKAEGAAWVWIAVNLGYLVLGVHFMYKKILPSHKLSWYLQDLVIPIGSAFLGAILVKFLWPKPETRLNELILIIAAASASSISALLVTDKLRGLVIKVLRSYLKKN